MCKFCYQVQLNRDDYDSERHDDGWRDNFGTNSDSSKTLEYCDKYNSSKEKDNVKAITTPLIQLNIGNQGVSQEKRREQAELARKIKAWAIVALKDTTLVKDPSAVVSVTEVICGEPGCPPLEVSIVAFQKPEPLQIRILKSLKETEEKDVFEAIKEKQTEVLSSDGEVNKKPIHNTKSVASGAFYTAPKPMEKPVAPVVYQEDNRWKVRKTKGEDEFLGERVW